MRRGEIWWSTPQLVGNERKRRPMLVVSHDAFNANESYPKVLVVHLTSVQRAGSPYDWEVMLPRGIAGLRRASIAKCAEVYTLWKRDLEARIGALPHELIEAVNRALALTLALPAPR